MNKFVVMTGQLFHGTKSVCGPQFCITALGVDGPYQARVISHLTGGMLDESDVVNTFKTVGEAAQWCYDHCDW